VTHLEGKEIRGSPFTVAVTGPARPSPKTLNLCEGEKIGGPAGRWVLEKWPGSESTERATRVNFLDVEYTWQPLECRLPTWHCMGLDSAIKRCYGEEKFVVRMDPN
jgi:hypothetical protein